MILNSIKLENIRSYTTQEINFPKGPTLLSGDIGSGKSSILLAIDFALFGLQKGSLSGNALLRNGKQKGSVELNFSVDNKDVTIKRVLKRTSTGINQDSGYVIVNNDKKELTAIELKQFILELLNYPQELLTKSKSLIYRYTVYTPQDEMKNILLGDKDNRLDTLRRVFGIDKYKRIKENSDLFTRAIREKRREFTGMVSDLEEKKQEKERKKDRINDVNNKIKNLEHPIKELSKEIEKKVIVLKKIEEKIKEFNNLSRNRDLLELEIKNKILRIEENNENIIILDKEIKETELELQKHKQDISKSDLEKLIAQKEMEIKFFEDTMHKISNKIRELEVKIEASTNIKTKVKDLNQCPICLQMVSKDYKADILKEETSKIKDFDESLEINIKQKREASKKLDELKENLGILKERDGKFGIIKIKLDIIKENSNKIDKLLQLKEKISLEVEALNNKKINLMEKIDSIKNVDDDFSINKKELDGLQLNIKGMEIELATLKQDYKNIQEIINSLDNEIERKLEIKNNLINYGVVQEWIEKFFNNIISVMEKKIMLKVHHDFNTLFENWFNIMVDTEELKIRLDDEFTPVIEQAGHEIDYNFLSGGEKTAAALSYRLALNQVINNLISTIKTKDLIILDEPTDGFSENQLDRLRLVLDELNTKQTIIVSHESKIESFVDNVIRLNKEGHISKIVR